MTAVRPSASIVIPTRGRAAYLDFTLASVAPQAASAGAELLVVCDGPDPESTKVAERRGAQVRQLPRRSGANAARNAGVAATAADLVIFLDDDVEAPPGWLAALLRAVSADSEARYAVFGGPIRARLEGGGPRSCGREPPPITTLDLGPVDAETRLVWSANMAVRRQALAEVGAFNEQLSIRGDEEEWLQRHLTAGGRTRYVAAAGIIHRRSAADSTLRSLARAAWYQGRAARRYDVHKGVSRASPYELRILLGCLWHTLRRRCLNGLVMAAHASGRLLETVRPTPPAPATEDYLSGHSGGVSGVRATTRAVLQDAALDLLRRAQGQDARVARAGADMPVRQVLVLAVERTDVPGVLDQARRELQRSRHQLEFRITPAAGAGKWEHLNGLLDRAPVQAFDWLVVLDDDVVLPRGFLDRFLFLSEHFGLDLTQPAHRRRSHAAWPVTRRRPLTLVRETGFVEIGPVFAFSGRAMDVLLPFPPLKAGWGLELHWSALARAHRLRQGVIDATPVAHRLRPIASSYSRDAAQSEARRFLADHRYLPAAEVARTFVGHRRL